jgi:hypothetical protein
MENEENKLCKCGKNPPSPDLHSCPFAVEIADNDDEDYCDCCDDCIYECAMDV